ncbi:MAG: FGGY family carbohydrate kinase [Gemmatimonadota bacterium]|nr:FGGY family carbohydrate kinase [Gemmatimonadota bacterium]
MSRHPLLAGIDVGTTNIKALVFDTAGRVQASASVPTPTHYPRPGWAYHTPDELWTSTLTVLRDAVSQLSAADAVSSLAVSSMAESGVPLDAGDRPTADIIAWFDGRTSSQAAWLSKTVGEERIYAITGLSLKPIFGLCKVLWLKENNPQAYASTVSWLNVADFIAFRLCGQKATDYSLASRMLVFDLHQRDWHPGLLEEAGVCPGLFAQALPSGTLLGRILPDVARSAGLSSHVQVTTGGHDHICGALAVGATEPGTLLNSLGTAEAVCMAGRRAWLSDQFARQGYTTGAHVARDRFYILGGIYTSGACVEWYRNLLGTDVEYGTLISEAKTAPPGSLGVHFQPHLRLGNPPNNDPESRGAFIGLNSDVTRGALFRAVLEGLAYECRLCLEAIVSHPEIDRPKRIVAIGGNTRNRLLMQIKSSVLNQRISIADVEESVALGAAVLGGLGAGVYADVDSALQELTYDSWTIEPNDEQVETYEAGFQTVYRGIFPSLQSLHRKLGDIRKAER